MPSDAITDEGDGFWATTAHQQLRYLQSIKSLLKINGRAAVIVPDNVRFPPGVKACARLRSSRRQRQPITLKT